MSPTPNPDVLVVGAGPVGLVAACELARRGVRVRVIDKLTRPTDQSRAIAVHARSLDMFDRMGIVDEMVSTGIKATAMQLYAGQSRLFRIPFGGVDSAFPFTLTTAQTETERVLGNHLQSLGVSVERGAELVALTQDGSTAHLTLRHDDGSTEQVSTSWVIGADGARSTVRKMVGTKLAGSFVGERFLLGDVDAEHGLDMDSMHTFFAPDGPVVVLPMLEGRMRFLAEVHDAPGTPMNMHPTQDELQAILDRRIGGIWVVRSHWLTSFEIHHARVPAYRWGRVFLVGDAAHIHSPAGGQGMNTGMQDAFNLAWKLAAVINGSVNGQAGDTLLDSYQAERIPVADSVITFTDRLTRAGTLSGAPRRIRDVVIRMLSHVPAARRFMANMAEEVNITYRNSPIVVGRGLKHAKVAAGDHLPHVVDAAVQKQLSAVCGVQNTGHVVLTVASGQVAPAAGEGQVQVLVTADDTPVAGYQIVVADPNGVVAQRLGLKNGGRVVIRPDGYIGAVASLDDIERVRAATTDMWADAPGGWVYEWSKLATEYADRGDHRMAALVYGCAKFPCLTNQARVGAMQNQLEQFQLAAKDFPVAFERRTITVPYRDGSVDVPVHLYSTDGDYATRPVLIASGGVDTWKMDIHPWWVGFTKGAGVTTLAFDHPGTGETAIPLDEHADEVIRGIADYARSIGNRRVAHFGASFGGNFSAMSGLAGIVDAAVDLGGPVVDSFGPENVKNLPYGMHDIVGNAMHWDHSPTLDELSAGLGALSRQNLLAQQRNSAMLVVNGADDYFVPQSDTLAFQGRPNTEVHLIEGTGHVAMSKASEVVPMIIAWLRTQLS